MPALPIGHPVVSPQDQLYAKVYKKNRKVGDTTHPNTLEVDTPVDQLYAQVNKKKSKKVCEDSPQ